MKVSLRWFLIASCINLLLSSAKAQRRRKTKSNGFVRGDDYENDLPGKAGLPNYRKISGDAVNTDVTPSTTKSTTTSKLSLTTTSLIASLLTRNDDSKAKGRFLPPHQSRSTTRSVVTTPNAVLQTHKDVPYRRPPMNSTEKVNHYSNRYHCRVIDGNRPRYRLCGYPLFYHPPACADIFCDQLPMKHCENEGGMVAFVLVTICLGILIVVGNAILPYLIARRTEMRNNHNYIKVSLSIADMLSGLVLIATIIPNVLQFRSTSESKFVESAVQRNSNVISTVAGVLLAISIEASLLHLLFLSVERFLTIQWAVKRGRFKRRTIALILFAVWMAAIIVAIIPVMAPYHFQYKMLPVLFLSFPMATPDNADSGTRQIIAYVCVVMLLPYTAMVVVCFSTWVTIRLRRMKNREFLSEATGSREQPKGILRKFRIFMQSVTKPSTDMAVFKTLLIMIGAFTITLLPLMMVSVLFASGYYNCDNYSLPYTLSFYASISNSFVNVLIYSVRDAQFKTAICPKMCCSQNAPEQNLGNVQRISTDL